MFSKKTFQLAARIGKKRLVHKINRRGGSFNVQKNDADLGFASGKHASYFDAACGGMYLGPQQTGS